MGEEQLREYLRKGSLVEVSLEKYLSFVDTYLALPFITYQTVSAWRDDFGLGFTCYGEKPEEVGWASFTFPLRSRIYRQGMRLFLSPLLYPQYTTCSVIKFSRGPNDNSDVQNE